MGGEGGGVRKILDWLLLPFIVLFVLVLVAIDGF